MRVLVVDANAETRNETRNLLHQWGWEVSEAGSTKDAQSRLEHAAYDAILLDPDVDGTEWTDAVSRVHDSAPRTALVVHSSSADWRLYLEALELGACDVLQKPCDPLELRRSLLLGNRTLPALTSKAS